MVYGSFLNIFIRIFAENYIIKRCYITEIGILHQAGQVFVACGER